MMTAVMDMIFLLHVEAMQLPDVVKWVMLGIQGDSSSGMWSLGGRGWKSAEQSLFLVSGGSGVYSGIA